VSRRFVAFWKDNRKFIALWSCAAHKTYNMSVLIDKKYQIVLFFIRLRAILQPSRPAVAAIPVAARA
jgi:hypothetical protein